jgi:RNA polymerase sigma-70 factor (ECF subfamily)
LGSFEAFQRRSSEKTWLTGILKHKIVDHFRKKGREFPSDDMEAISDAIDDFFDERGGWKLRPAKWRVDPLKLLETKEFRQVLFECLRELSKRLSRVFILRELEGLDTAEICKALNITASNCWVILYRARMKMRHCLEFNWFEGEAIDQS